VKFEYAFGATPLDLNEIAGLLPQHLTTQAELNMWEQANILEAEKWVFSHKRSDILSINFCMALHKKMFNKTWQWAGQIRKTDKNIGIMWEQISSQLKILFDDTKYQIKYHVYLIDELAARFHHRLVFIHPFANGNGRHARLMTDVLLYNQGANVFTWGQTGLISNSKTRAAYIAALREADKGNYAALFAFVR